MKKSFSVKRITAGIMLLGLILGALGCSQTNKTPSSVSNNVKDTISITKGVLEHYYDGTSDKIIEEVNEELKKADPMQFFMNKVDSTNDMVICLGNGSLNYATVYYYKRVNGRWEKQWETPSRIGRNGFSVHTYEGDVTTPEGVFNLGVAFGNKPNPGTALNWFDVKDYHYWVDEPASDYFNQLIDAREIPTGWNSAEHLIDFAYSYDYSINIEVNPECRKDTVSAIFLHCFSETRGTTAGCVSIDEEHMVKVLQAIQPGARMCIARDYETLYSFVGEKY